MTLADLDRAALNELAAEGYSFDNVAEAADAAEAFLGLSREAALVWLGAGGDVVTVDE